MKSQIWKIQYFEEKSMLKRKHQIEKVKLVGCIIRLYEQKSEEAVVSARLEEYAQHQNLTNFKVFVLLCGNE